jgi:hypothetical protein
MADNRLSEGRMISLAGATAASSIVAGTLVATNTGGNSIYSYCKETVGLSGTGGAIGIRFIGILDDNVSAGQNPVNVWVEGVFALQFASSISTAYIGQPVYSCISGAGMLISNSGTTGEIPLGTIVGLGRGELSGQYVHVKITPGAFNWGCFGRVDAIATADAVLEFGNLFPPVL